MFMETYLNVSFSPNGATTHSGPLWRMHDDTSDTSHSVWLLWKSDQPVAQTSPWQQNTLNKRQTSMLPAGFEPTIPAIERPQTHALACAANGISLNVHQWAETPYSVQWLGYKDRSNEKNTVRFPSEAGAFLFAKAPRPALVSIQRHILWIIGIFPWG